MFEGSLYAAGWEAIFTFMILITFANKKGEVEMSLDHLSGRTNVPKKILQKGIDILSEPDKESKSKSDDGRRIILMDPDRTWGWQIVNYEKYAKARDMEAIRQYWAEEKRKRKESKDSDIPF
jgi:hypothetical protein